MDCREALFEKVSDFFCEKFADFLKTVSDFFVNNLRFLGKSFLEKNPRKKSQNFVRRGEHLARLKHIRIDRLVKTVL